MGALQPVQRRMHPERQSAEEGAEHSAADCDLPGDIGLNGAEIACQRRGASLDLGLDFALNLSFGAGRRAWQNGSRKAQKRLRSNRPSAASLPVLVSHYAP